MFRLQNIVIFVSLYSVINTKVSSAAISIPSKSSLIKVKTNQENGGRVNSSALDIHLVMESGGNWTYLRSVTRDEIKSILNYVNNSTIVENPDEKNPIASRSVKYDLEKNNAPTNLENINAKFQTIESILKDIQMKSNKSSYDVGQESSCLLEQSSLGVHGYRTKSQRDRNDYPKNCKDALRKGNNLTGVYEIFPKHSVTPFPVLCDMEIRGGGWTHIQKRFDGSQDFFLNWRDYKFGFGNIHGEFWLGLQKIYLLSGFESTELLVEIVDRDNISAFAHYTSFAIGSEPGGYKLDRLSGFSGDAGDALAYQLGSKFSTKDLDFTNDACPTKYLGGWWYKACLHSNLNGKYININLPEKFNYQGMQWETFRSYEYCHAKARMLVRPLN